MNKAMICLAIIIITGVSSSLSYVVLSSILTTKWGLACIIVLAILGLVRVAGIAFRWAKARMYHRAMMRGVLSNKFN